MKKNIFFLLFFSCALSAQEKKPIVLIHGFLGAPWNFYLFSKNFKKKGFEVTNFSYSSREKMIEDHGQDLLIELQHLAKENPKTPIDFVAHSMGSLVLRSALNHPDCPDEAKIGKAVLLAPASKGSTMARSFSRFSLFRRFMRNHSGKQLYTNETFDDIGDLPPSMKDVLIISGNFGFSPFISGENDGTLTVCETCLNTPHNHMILNTGHKGILFNKDAFINAHHFLISPPIKK